MFEKVKTWVSGNPIMAVVAAFAGVLLFFPRMFRSARRRRTRRAYRPAAPVRRRRRLFRSAAPVRRSAPRRKVYGKNGRAKKPWQIKGSRAARLHMAKIRRMR